MGLWRRCHRLIAALDLLEGAWVGLEMEDMGVEGGLRTGKVGVTGAAGAQTEGLAVIETGVLVVAGIEVLGT